MTIFEPEADFDESPLQVVDIKTGDVDAMISRHPHFEVVFSRELNVWEKTAVDRMETIELTRGQTSITFPGDDYLSEELLVNHIYDLQETISKSATVIRDEARTRHDRATQAANGAKQMLGIADTP